MFEVRGIFEKKNNILLNVCNQSTLLQIDLLLHTYIHSLTRIKLIELLFIKLYEI